MRQPLHGELGVRLRTRGPTLVVHPRATRVPRRVEAPQTEYGDCECYCDGSYQGNIDVDDGQGGVGVTESFCDNNGPPACPNEGFTCDQPLHGELGVQLRIHGGQLWWSTPGDSGPPPGGSASAEYGDCECYCDGSYQGNIDVDDGQGGVGVTESFCDNNGPPACPMRVSRAPTPSR